MQVIYCFRQTYLIVEFFRDLGGINPLVKDLSSQRMEALMSNHQEEDKNEINEDFYSFSELSVKHKVKVLFFFCNYCMTFSGRMPLYKDEINKSKEETIVLNKRIAPFFSTKDGTDYYTFPLNKDCRIYKEQLSLLSPIKSNKETFSICVSTYEEMYGKKPVLRAIHAGLECGILSQKMEGLDCVAETSVYFTPLDNKTVEEFRKKFDGKQAEKTSKKTSSVLPFEQQASFFNKNIELTAAKIVEITENPDSDKLYIEKLDDGSGKLRTIQSGLRPYLKKEDLTPFAIYSLEILGLINK